MKKIFCLVVVIAMIAALAIPTFADEEVAAPTEGLVAHLTFDDAENGLSGNGAVATPMNGKTPEDTTDPTISSDAKVGNGAYDFGTNDDHAWLSVTKEDGSSLLTGATAITVSYWSNNDAASTKWMFFATPNDENGAPTEMVYPSVQEYVGIFEAATIHSEFFHLSVSNERTYSDETPVNPANEWKLITVVFNSEMGAADGSINVYVNGEWEGGSGAVTHENHSIADLLGESHSVFLGMATWGDNDEFAGGLMDDLYIYNRALSADEVKQLATAQGVEGLISGNEPSEGTDAPEGTQAPETGKKPEGTQAPEGTKAPAETDAKTEGGCGSTLGAAAAIVALTSVFGCAIIKKH